MEKDNKTIHFIWLGKIRIPREIINTWIDESHDIKVWRDFPDPDFECDIDIKELGDFENKKLFEQSTKYNQKSDILRLIILYRYGGLYMDCDILRTNFDIDVFSHIENMCLNDNKTNFFISYEKKDCISNSIIYVSDINNKTINHLIKGLNDCQIFDENGKYISVCESTGPKFITKLLIDLQYDMNLILPYHIVNFGIDYAKGFSSKNFIINDKMKTVKKNKDLRYNPVENEILGIQIWAGGKSSNYNNISDNTILVIKNNIEQYKNFVFRQIDNNI